MKILLEKELEKKFVETVKLIGGQAWKFTSPNMAGVPDRIVLLPGGKMFFAELKKPGEKLRPLQVKRKQQLEELGFQVEVIDSPEAIKTLTLKLLLTGGDPFRD